MKLDEFAFVNQQLAGMLKAGLPLEGSLKQLCATMQRGKLKSELELLEADLAKGISLKEALAARKLPEFYVRMLQVGAQSNDLPGVLLLLADYYSKVNAIGTRLKGLMVYPLLVLLTATAVSVLLAFVFQALFYGSDGFLAQASRMFDPKDMAWMDRRVTILTSIWLPAFTLAAVSIGLIAALAIPRLRHSLRWWVPGFKEAGLAQFASSMNLLLCSGNSLNDALGLVRRLESGRRIGNGLARWQALLADGQGKMSDLTALSASFPPLFLWLVSNGGEDLASGFRRAAEIYYARAAHRVEMLLFAALPISILMLSLLILFQAYSVIRMFSVFIVLLDKMGG